jgi:cytochrome c oxidase subunit II
MRKTHSTFLVLMALNASVGLIALARGESAPRRIEITARRFAFEPADITLKKGETVDLVLKSTDAAHGLRFRELNFDLKAGKDGSGEVHFTPSQTGTFIGHCSVFCGVGHGTMTLRLHVVD